MSSVKYRTIKNFKSPWVLLNAQTQQASMKNHQLGTPKLIGNTVRYKIMSSQSSSFAKWKLLWDCRTIWLWDTTCINRWHQV